MKTCRWPTYCKAFSFSSGSWHVCLFLRSRRLKPSSPVWSDDWHCIGTAPPQSTDRILANEIGIHLLSFTLKCVLEDESLFLLSECRKGDFPISEGEFECCSTAMARDRRGQGGRELETWTREQMQWPGYLVKECARQSQPYPWENSNDTSKCARHKREPGVFSSVTYTKKSAACIQPCCTSLSGLGNLKPPPNYAGPPLSPSTPIPSTLTSLHLDHLSLLTRRVWPTPTHSGYSLRKYNSCRKQVIILLLVVSPTPLIYIFWLFAGFGQGVCWIYFLLQKNQAICRFKIVSSSKWFYDPLNSTGFRHMQYPEIPSLCYQRNLPDTSVLTLERCRTF